MNLRTVMRNPALARSPGAFAAVFQGWPIDLPFVHRFVRGRAGLIYLSCVMSISFAVSEAGSAASQSAVKLPYPEKPIRVIVSAAAGGGTDILARLIGGKLTEAWGQPIVVDNRAGAGQTIGTGLAAKSAPDGYTLLFGTSVHAVNPSLYRKLSYDAVRDFEPITLLASAPQILVVHPSVPVRTLKEFIALAKTRPHKINYGSSGNGGTGHLAMEMLKSMAGIDLLHVPYKGTAPALNALLAAEVSAQVNTVMILEPFIRSGRLRALGVASGSRSSAVPEVPTIAEAGVSGFDVTSWFGVWAPARTPSAIVAMLNTEIVRILKLRDVRERFASLGVEPVGSSAEEFAAVIRSDLTKWQKVIKTFNIVPD